MVSSSFTAFGSYLPFLCICKLNVFVSESDAWLTVNRNSVWITKTN